MADSSKVQVGDQIVIVGAPYGLSYSLSVGYISARWAPNTVYRTMPLAEFFQTDATINTGNSGGPMFAMNGDVVGIISHNISKGGGSEGLGFVVALNDRTADLLNLPNRSSGFVVKTVAKDSPADQIGLRGSTMIVPIAGQEVPLGGDIIMTVNGIAAAAANMAKIRESMNALPPGGPFKVTILRAGQVLELTGKAP
jgi:S1-C subfamily serine protease